MGQAGKADGLTGSEQARSDCLSVCRFGQRSQTFYGKSKSKTEHVHEVIVLESLRNTPPMCAAERKPCVNRTHISLCLCSLGGRLTLHLTAQANWFMLSSSTTVLQAKIVSWLKEKGC